MPASRNAWTSWANTGCVICRWSKKGRVVGVITSTDLLILTVNEKDNIIEQLERYLSPGGY